MFSTGPDSAGQHPAQHTPFVFQVPIPIRQDIPYCCGVSLRFTSSLTCWVRHANPSALCCTSVLVARSARTDSGAPVMKKGLRSSLGDSHGSPSALELVIDTICGSLLNRVGSLEHHSGSTLLRQYEPVVGFLQMIVSTAFHDEADAKRSLQGQQLLLRAQARALSKT